MNNNSTLDTALIKAAIEYGHTQAINEIPMPKQLEEYSSFQLNKAANDLRAAALDKGYVIEFNEDGFKAIKPLIDK